jgi:membrane-bound lytic murein transglycosylase D
MKQARLGTILLAALTCTACAHHKSKPISDTQRETSVSFPLILPQESDPGQKESVVKPTPEDLKPPYPEPEKLPPPKNEPAIAVSVNPPEKTARAIEAKPNAITIPKAKQITANDIGPRRESDTPLIFDIPIAYNSRVKYWIEYFQTSGRSWYTKWLERSTRYLPAFQKTLKKHGLPQDLAYIAMIESGFSTQASSHASAVGPWQFIRETGTRYGLRVNWWLDERRDFMKSTEAAAKYLKKMYGMFHNWYLVAAGYNTGENRIKRLVKEHRTKNFWKIAQKNEFHSETRDYVPKLIAALLIAKSPQMYGFYNVNYLNPFKYEHFRVPGGTKLDDLADAIGVAPKLLQELNPDLLRGYVPNFIGAHTIRIPKGSAQLVSRYVRRTLVSER